MLNRFKNAIYGSSNSFDEGNRIENDYREAIISKRIRGALTRSSSFREDLLGDSSRFNSKHTYNRQDKLIQAVTTPVTEQHCSISKSTVYSHNNSPRLPKFRYSRPDFLQLKTDDEILVSADHQIRPIILPRDANRLPWKSGYAECINAGKSLRNEDQAACFQDVLIKTSTSIQDEGVDSNSLDKQIPWVFFGIFDGHAGTAVAVAAASQLHHIINEKLRQITSLLLELEFGTIDSHDSHCDEDSDEYTDCSDKHEKGVQSSQLKNRHQTSNSTGTSKDSSTEQESDQALEGSYDETKSQPPSQASISVKSDKQFAKESSNCLEPVQDVIDDILFRNKNVTVASLITGALESAFWEMDSLIADDKYEYKMPGGCTAIVSLFILGKLYVCNAGDSRAIVYKNGEVIPMSFDFTPNTERERILRLGLQRPEFLGSDFTHLEFIRRPTRCDIGKQILYKDAYMTGWSMKRITHEDLKFPLIWGEGKRSRVLATIGVTRGFGDHELRAQLGSVPIKPFLTPEPEIKILPLEDDDSLRPEDVLIMGSDGLWDVTTNEEAASIVKSSFELFLDNEESRAKYRYMTAAQDLVIHSRGHTTNWSNVWRTNDSKSASLDDIAVFVIPLKQYRDEYIEWKQLRSRAQHKVSQQHHSKACEER